MWGESDHKPLDDNQIELQGCAAVLTPGHIVDCRFQLILPSRDIIELCAPSHTLMLNWTEAINIAANYKVCENCSIKYVSGYPSVSKFVCSVACEVS
jgi:hypothetical protein